MRAWMVRAGSEGEREEPALSEAIVAAGWTELVDDLTDVADREQLRALVEATYPDYSPRVIGNWVGQLWRFRHEMSIGDLVVMPRRSRQLALGVITSEYVFRHGAEPGLQHTRQVKWERTGLERRAVQQDLLDSMGSLLTIFELRRYDAARRVAALLNNGKDPGSRESGPESRTFSSWAKLLEAAIEAPADQPLAITTRRLIEAWGLTRRSSASVDQIEADLADKGLTARPPINTGSIDSLVTLLRIGAEPGPDQPLLTDADVPDETVEQAPLTYRINHLASATGGVVSVSPSDTPRKAITAMVYHDYSQLPVLDDSGRLCGVVTWESIGRARVSGSPLTLADIATPDPLNLLDQAELLPWVSQIQQRGYAFVHDSQHKIIGIVTASDLSFQFGVRVQPFVLLEELEQRLRRLINQALMRGTLTLAQIHSKLLPHRRKRVHAADDLTLGEYPHVLEPTEHWEALDWDVDQSLVVDSLNECTEFRNRLMHFSPDPLPDSELAPVRGLLEVLRALDPTA
ncbi:CBS domain-containing protein [Streptomyces sp. NPDC001852]|uniref:CBS domain-containing protein n=1 Tax=Streptomyces sp. NPDC001852 TaxID=3364619 RepID=UPI0036CE0CB3